MNKFIEISVQRDPPWQADEDRIIGAMIRKILAFAGEAYTESTCRAMQAIVEAATWEAHRVGANPARVEDIARHITVRVWPDWPWARWRYGGP